MSATASDRRTMLERCCQAYGDLHLALAFTNGIDGDDAKKNDRAGAGAWKRATPLGTGDQGAAILAGRGPTRNPIIVLGASGLVGIDVDGDHGRDLARQLVLPPTVAVRTGNGGHLWYRRPDGANGGVVKVQLAGKVTVSSDGYLVCPPAIHPTTGRLYEFVPGRAPWEIAVAELPIATVEKIIAAARLAQERVLAATGPVGEGDRHEHLRRIAWVLRRYSGASLEAITAALLAENAGRCQPPKEERLVRALAQYTFDHWSPKGNE